MAIFSLANKTTVITGGGSGIGKEIAIAFARQGASVHIIENDAKAGELVWQYSVWKSKQQ